jgi:uncharacterized surface protein with fasciclin (FAS1) repeats
MEDLMRALSFRPLGSLRPLFVALSLAVATIVSPSGMAMAQQPQSDIVDTAVAAGSFTTLAAALQAAGLVDTLKGDGPFTVFAPTDAAFAKLPAGTLEALLADPAKLQAVLTYHVVPGRVTAADVATLSSAADVATLSSAATVQGAPIAIDTSMGVRVNDAHVTQADVMASNGVIHVIDTVLLPPGL